jgi:hypothetical protein
MMPTSAFRLAQDQATDPLLRPRPDHARGWHAYRPTTLERARPSRTEVARPASRRTPARRDRRNPRDSVSSAYEGSRRESDAVEWEPPCQRLAGVGACGVADL